MRLTKIYTRTGDDGKTYFAGKRIGKDSLAIELIGTLDELNSCIGLTMSFIQDHPGIISSLTQIQQNLFDLGGELDRPDQPVMNAKHIETLEKTLDEWNDTLPPLKEFVLPRGNSAACACHVARTVCRRAERLMVSYRLENPSTNLACLHYLNRLSDLLFVCARILARNTEPNEILWEK